MTITNCVLTAWSMASGELASPAMSDALVILGAAGLVIPVFTRFKITPVIGFILIGIVYGSKRANYNFRCLTALKVWYNYDYDTTRIC